jgi:hypothetical protein
LRGDERKRQNTSKSVSDSEGCWDKTGTGSVGGVGVCAVHCASPITRLIRIIDGFISPLKKSRKTTS